MKKTSVYPALICCLLLAGDLSAQSPSGSVTTGPYTVRNSGPFETPKKFEIRDPLTFPDGVLQISARDLEFNFQWFSNDLKKVKENTVDASTKFSQSVGLWGFVKFKTKVYCFGREVFRETENEGITALEIDPHSLDIKGSAQNLYKSSWKVQYGEHNMSVCENRTKFMLRYRVVNKEKDKYAKTVMGIEVFDENLANLWGGELEMPYSEAKMDNLGYTLTNEGKVCILAKVYEGIDSRDGAKDKLTPNYHYEVLIYKKGSTTPEILVINLDKYFNKEAYIFQDKMGNMLVAGFYGHQAGDAVDGAYLLPLNIDQPTASPVVGGFYEIPVDFIKSFMSERQLNKAAKKAEKKGEEPDFELSNLVIRDIYNTPDGSTKIVSEIYYMVEHTSVDSKGNTRTHYSYVYKDVVIMNLKGGKLEWIRKIPKNTETGGNTGLLSINTMVTGNDLHIFWKDKPENSLVPDGEKLSKFAGTNGMLRACTVTPNGELKKYDVVDTEQYDMRFSLREFTDNRNNSLMNTERSKKKNVIFAIDVKP